MNKKYRVHELVRLHYSDIGEYIDEYHTDRPLRNDILVDLLNNQNEQIQELLSCNHGLAQKQIQILDRLIQLEKENNQLKKKIMVIE